MTLRLEDQEILLRALEPDDLDVLYSVENNPANWMVSGTLTPFSRDMLRRYINNAHQDLFEARQLRMAITAQNTRLVLGFIDLFDFDPRNRRAGLGIILMPKYRGKGYAQRAIQIMLDYCFNHLNLSQLYAEVPALNDKSIQLFEASGFVKTGTKIQWLSNGNHYSDVHFYQRVNDLT